MGETRRDRSKLALGQIARWVFEGDEDPELLREYALEVKALLDRVIGQAASPEDNKALAHLMVFFVYLTDALDPDGHSRMELRAVPRKTSEQGGRRSLSYDEKLRRKEAGARAYRYYVGDGLPKLSKIAAIERAWADMGGRGRAEGLSKRIIERALDCHRREMETLTAASQ